VPDAGEAPGFVQDAIRKVALRDFRFQELECDGMIQPHVMGVEDFAERACSDATPQQEMTPAAYSLSLRAVRRQADVTDARALVRSCFGGRVVGGAVNRRTVVFRDIGDDAKVFKELPSGIVSWEPADLFPID
jgi:hypothetical protein